MRVSARSFSLTRGQPVHLCCTSRMRAQAVRRQDGPACQTRDRCVCFVTPDARSDYGPTCNARCLHCRGRRPHRRCQRVPRTRPHGPNAAGVDDNDRTACSISVLRGAALDLVLLDGRDGLPFPLLTPLLLPLLLHLTSSRHDHLSERHSVIQPASQHKSFMRVPRRAYRIFVRKVMRARALRLVRGGGALAWLDSIPERHVLIRDLYCMRYTWFEGWREWWRCMNAGDVVAVAEVDKEREVKAVYDTVDGVGEKMVWERRWCGREDGVGEKMVCVCAFGFRNGCVPAL